MWSLLGIHHGVKVPRPKRTDGWLHTSFALGQKEGESGVQIRREHCKMGGWREVALPR